MKSGKLIIFEGIDKCGKSTQVQRLIGYLIGKGHSVVEAKEPPFPGGKIPDIRQEIMDLRKNHPSFDGLALAEAELELFLKVRRIYYTEVIIPALAFGKIVVCDRGPDSTLAFQGHARGIDLEKIRKGNKFATFDRPADLTLLFDLEPEIATKRITKEDQVNRFESELMDFHQKVKMGYLKEALYDTEHKIKLWQTIWADADKNVITKKMLAAVKKHLGL